MGKSSYTLSLGVFYVILLGIEGFFSCSSGGCLTLLLLFLTLGVANAQEIGGVLADTSNFLDSGLATLGALSAWINAAVRGRLDFECALREATYVHCHTLALSPLESLWAFIADVDDLHVTFALFTVGECRFMDRALAWWLVNRTEATVEVVSCKWYSERLDCSGNPSAQPHACGCLFIPSSFLDRHSLCEKDSQRCKPHDDTHAVVYCSDCVLSKCHGVLSPTERKGNYWEAISDCLTTLACENAPGSIILADADIFLATLALLRRSAISGDEQERNAQTRLFDVLDDPERCSSAEFEKVASDNNPFRYGIMCCVEVFIHLALIVTLHLDAFSAGLAARRIMRSYVGDSSGTGSMLELFFPRFYIGSDSRVFAAGFPAGRYTLWRLVIILLIRSTGPVAGLALWSYFILSGSKKLLYSSAYTTPPAMWAVWYSATIAALQAITGCTIGYKAIVEAQSNPATCLRVCVATLVQVSYVVMSTLHGARGQVAISWRVLLVAQEMVITFQWFVCCLLIRNNPRSVLGSTFVETAIRWWYSTTFLQIVAITTMGGKWK